MFRTIYDRLASLTFGLWLTFGVIFFLGIGSFWGGGEEGSSINEMALLQWLRVTSFGTSWWLWVTVALLAILALNTVLCSIESLRAKWQRDNFLVRIAPQVMHLGFLLIVLAHLFSAAGSEKGAVQVMEGHAIEFPDGSRVQFNNFQGSIGQMGMMTDFSADVSISAHGIEKTHTISPNHPAFHNGYGVYLKDLGLERVKAALVEIHREPGAGAALAGALLFTIGNVVLLAVRRGR
ncbi:MAG: cytochrome c biogenesis protein ResB [Geobacter sp.]|nr:cytochrome c biogenesis protein ResB [Geobacter sp.]